MTVLPNFPGWMLLPAIIVLIGLAVGVSLLMDRKHSRDMSALAPQLGFDFLGNVQIQGLGGTRFFKHRGWFKNVMVRKNDPACMLFEYVYQSGRAQLTQTAIAFEIYPPYFEIRKRKLWHRIAGLFGYDHISFQGKGHFTDCYLVRGKSEGDVRRALKPQALEYLANLANEWDWCVESNGHWMIIYRDNKWLKFRRKSWSIENSFSERLVVPKLLPEFVEEATRIANAIKCQRDVSLSSHRTHFGWEPTTGERS